MSAAEATVNQLAAALRYVQLGWAVFPLHSVVNGKCTCGDPHEGAARKQMGKHPRTRNGCKAATVDQAIIRGWWRTWPDANIGIATGTISGIWALDVDTDKGGDETLGAFSGVLPSTVEAYTGSGGRHLLFALPDFRIGNSVESKLGNGLDTRGDGGYIVAAPSVHYSGRQYEWRIGRGPGTAVAAAPEWLLAMLRPAAVAAPPRRPDPLEAEVHVLRRARAYLDNTPGAVSGERGHDATFIAAQRMVRGFELNDSDAYAVLVDWNTKCVPPWSEALLRRKIVEAREKGTMPFGHLRDQPDPKRVAPPPSQPAENQQSESHKEEAPPKDGNVFMKAYRQFTIEELEEDPPLREYVWKPYIPKGLVTMLNGPGGSNKTTLMTYLAVARALGVEMFPGVKPEQGHTAIYTTEDRHADYREKMAALRIHLGVRWDSKKVREHVHTFDVSGQFIRMIKSDYGQFEPTAYVRQFIEAVKVKCPQVSLIIMETVSRMTGGQESNESLSVLTDAAQMICIETGAATTLVGHVSQEAARNGTADAYAGRGGSAGGDNGRSTMILTRLNDKNKAEFAKGLTLTPEQMKKLLVFNHSKSNGPAAEPIIIEKVLNRMGIVLRALNADAAKPLTDAELMDRLRVLVKRLTADGVEVTESKTKTYADEIGVSTREVGRLIDSAIGKKLIKKTKKIVQGGGKVLVAADGPEGFQDEN